jgi:hypothetical protein
VGAAPWLVAEGGAESVDSSWPPVLVACAVVLAAVVIVSIVVVLRHARAATRTPWRRDP